ncbi:MAG: RDD family protein [Chloroflexi bacterium]|nr:RDD family protein [Chloroflexota bacterium]
MICPTCNTENEARSQFCAGCGILLEAGVATVSGASGLAGRGARLLAAIVDAVILGGALFIVTLTSGISSALAVIAVVAIPVILIVQVVLLTKDGQTLGKKALNIRIVKRDTGQNGGFVTNVLVRWVVNGILGIIPFYGIVDILFIFREDRRCLHDFIAGTQVVNA